MGRIAHNNTSIFIELYSVHRDKVDIEKNTALLYQHSYDYHSKLSTIPQIIFQVFIYFVIYVNYSELVT